MCIYIYIYIYVITVYLNHRGELETDATHPATVETELLDGCTDQHSRSDAWSDARTSELFSFFNDPSQ